MKPNEYIQALEKLIVDSRLINASQTKEKRVRRFEAYIKVRLTLIDDSVLEVTEYIHATEEANAQVIRYNYYWMDSSNQLRIRWDNVRHYPQLPGFPHHIHDGDEKNVLPGEPMNLFKVMDQIAARLSN